MVLAGAFGVLFSWFFQPFLYTEEMNRLTERVFDASGIVFPAFTLVAFAIGAFLGMLFRRVIPALAATLGVYLAVRLAAWGVRKYYPVAVVTSNSQALQPVPDAQPARVPVDPEHLGHRPGRQAGQPVRGQPDPEWPGPQARTRRSPPGYTEWNRWIPLSHYWPMQFIEAGWLLVLAVALMAGTVWLVRRRAA